MTTDNTLPFELNRDGMTSWVDSLSGMPQVQAAHELAVALKQLKDIDSSHEELLPILIGLTPLTVRFSNNIGAIAYELKNFEKSRKPAKFSMQLLRQLSMLFCQIAEDSQLSVENRHAAIYYALQSIGHCIRCYAQFYETPSSTLWKKSALLYSLATELNCLTAEHRITFPDFKHLPTIESVIKRNILFNILNVTLHSVNEINQLFVLANQLADQLAISSAPDNLEFGFYWDLSDELPPCPTRKSRRPLPKGFLAIDSQAIGSILQADENIANLTRNLQTKLGLQLLNYEPIFDSIIPGQILRAEFLFGFDDVAAFLSGLNRIQKIKQLSGHKNSNQIKRNLALVPMEQQKDAFETMSQMLAKSNTVSKTGNVLKISNPEYLVAEGSTFDCSTGDIAMFYRELEPATLSVIRQQSAISISNVNHILMEKVTGFYSIYSFKSGNTIHHAIVIDEDSDNRQVFLPPGKYNVDTVIELTIDETLHLTACMESNGYFARFRFRFGA
ncbi:MAG: hypothetical protein ACU836_07690 [Gammaproteobacteria bacterium]